MTVIKGPGRVAMKHDNRLSATLIQIVVLDAPQVQKMGFKRIEGPDAVYLHAMDAWPRIMPPHLRAEALPFLVKARTGLVDRKARTQVI